MSDAGSDSVKTRRAWRNELEAADTVALRTALRHAAYGTPTLSERAAAQDHVRGRTADDVARMAYLAPSEALLLLGYLRGPIVLIGYLRGPDMSGVVEK